MKKLLTILMAAILILGLAACSNSAVNTSTSTDAAAKQKESAAESGEASIDAETGTPSDVPGTPPDGTPPDGNGGPGGAPGGSSAELSYTGAVEITSADTQDGQSYASTSADESALLIATSDAVTVSNATVTKTGDSDGGLPAQSGR